eukprot:CAMPEP_0114565072 /NCGR_PEP_ID=MMETSP0114-20121206/14098_1 /TAXON_ID=31324 /ORGANISM="Goniomonas sp, Strain m" /LENGTH=143 /DNA_ID=CAMNT_0001751261 /DNA_START=1 /DNA_END=429 /DNA_ORIENTATION=+
MASGEVWAVAVLVLTFLASLGAKIVARYFLSEDPQVSQLKKEILELKKESNDLNSPDTIIKYFKVQRQLNRTEDALAIAASRPPVPAPRLQALHKTLEVAPYLFLFIFWNRPMCSFLADTVWPIGCLLAFPSQASGSVGIVAW